MVERMALEKLSLEVDRIVSAPYLVSLKGLHDILRHESCTTSTLRTWAAFRPCQIDTLASIVLDSIKPWPYTLDILSSLVSIEAFRDSVLQLLPTILDELLEGAVADGQDASNSIKSDKVINF
ncbi:hypothetical protein FQN52_000775 [Onygenales sp. PD_12]|nr:hypothetical protein FQN52_000775 [Onygenales sp. PD_12]